MEGSMSKMMVLFAVTTFMAMLAMGATAADYTVGGSQGWNLGVSYANWASGKTFEVGDTLEFKYAPTAHNLLEVSKSSYDSCSIANPMKTYTSGSDKITLSSAGPKYFICGFTGHCSGGMKVSINVMASSPSSNSTKSPSPSPTKSPASPTPSSSSASGPGPSGMTTTPTSASTPGGVGASPPNSDNSAASSLSAAILSFLGAVVLLVF